MYQKFRLVILIQVGLVTLLAGCEFPGSPDSQTNPDPNTKTETVKLMKGYKLVFDNFPKGQGFKKRDSLRFDTASGIDCYKYMVKGDTVYLLYACRRTTSTKLISLNLKRAPEGDWKSRTIKGRKYYYQVTRDGGGASMSQYTISIYTKFKNGYALYSGTGLYEDGIGNWEPAESALDWKIITALKYDPAAGGL